MKYLPLIWAALWRKPAELLLTLLAVTAAFTLFSMMWGVNLTVRHIIDRSRMDLLTVQQRGTYHIPNGLPLSIESQLQRIDGVVGVGAVRSLNGYHTNPHQHVGVITVDEGMQKASPSGDLITPSQWTRLFAMPSGILVSLKAAKKWSLKEGDTFTVTTEPGSRLDGGDSWEFQVLGIIADDPDSSSDDGSIMGNSHYLENTLPLSRRGFGYSFQVAIKDAHQAILISKRIDREYATSGTPTFSAPNRINEQQQLNRGLDTASMTAAIASAGLIMILFVTGSAIARSVRERVPEFAALAAVGYGNFQVVMLVFVEAAIPCLLGAVLGAGLAQVLGGWSIRLLGLSPVDLLQIPAPALPVLGWGLGFGLLLALAGSAIPVLRLRYLSVNDALAGR